MKKKLLSLFLSMLFVFSFGACGKSQEKERHDFCTYSEWTTTKQATCLNPGTQERHCTICGNKETRNIPITDNHTISNGKCTSCGEITNTYDAFAYYISQNSHYYSEYANYRLLLRISYWENTRCEHYAYYYPNEHRIIIAIVFGTELLFEIILNHDNATYEYGIVDNENNIVVGPFFPSTFSINTTSLICATSNVTDATLKEKLCLLGVPLAHLLLQPLTEDIEDSGITAKDLGFKNY